MKTCGCEGSDKAYVIVSPDSPDRQQILSLNPPICREVKGNILKYVVNSEQKTFIGTKEINSSNSYALNTVSGGVQVDWGGGDIEILTGSNPTITALTRTVYRYHYNVTFQAQWSYNRFSGVGTWSNQTRALYFNRKVNSLVGRCSTSSSDPFAGSTANPPIPPITISDSSESRFASTTGRWVYYWIKVSDTLGFDSKAANTCVNPIQASRGVVVSGWQNVFSIASSADPVKPFTSGGSILSITPICSNVAQTETYGYTVTTSTNATSTRTTATAPIVSPVASGYQLIFNYLDGSQSLAISYATEPTSFQLINNLEISDTTGILKNIYPYQNQNVVIQCGERQCPPETCCNPCEGSALNCCYDENGRLIDSFIRRT